MRKCLVSFITVVSVVISLPVISCAEVNNSVVAVVNGVPINEPDLNQEINAIMPLNQSFHGKLSEEKMDRIRSEALKKLVDLELQAQDAHRKGLKVTQALDEEMNKLIARFQTKEELVTAYKGSGFSEKSFMRLFERNLLAEKIKQQEVDAKVTVTPEMVKKYYSDNVARYSKPEEFRARHILLKVDPSSSQENRLKILSRAEDILKRIKKGENFEELALKESDDPSRIKGGDLGYFHAGQTVVEFEAALLKLKVSETSSVVESIYGYHIIQLIDKRPPRQIPFEEIKDKITKDMVDSEKTQLFTRWMDDLYKKAKISYPGAQ